MHTCPAFLNFVLDEVTAAIFTSASFNTKTGACPPSSIEIFLIPSAANFKISFPTSTDPVKETFFTIGDLIKYFEIKDDFPVTKFTTPFGTPASLQACIICMHVPGVSLAGLRIIEQPAAIEAATFLAGNKIGKFQALKAATTPTGS